MEGQTEKNFNHKTAYTLDLISALGELEHAFWHAKRSAISLYDPEKKDDSDFGKYAIWAKEIKEVRREFQKRAFPGLSEYDWCLLKALSRVRQLAYETIDSDYKTLKSLDGLLDDITSDMLKEDLSGCSSCRNDREDI